MSDFEVLIDNGVLTATNAEGKSSNVIKVFTISSNGANPETYIIDGTTSGHKSDHIKGRTKYLLVDRISKKNEYITLSGRVYGHQIENNGSIFTTNPITHFHFTDGSQLATDFQKLQQRHAVKHCTIFNGIVMPGNIAMRCTSNGVKSPIDAIVKLSEISEGVMEQGFEIGALNEFDNKIFPVSTIKEQFKASRANLSILHEITEFLENKLKLDGKGENKQPEIENTITAMRELHAALTY